MRFSFGEFVFDGGAGCCSRAAAISASAPRVRAARAAAARGPRRSRARACARSGPTRTWRDDCTSWSRGYARLSATTAPPRLVRTVPASGTAFLAPAERSDAGSRIGNRLGLASEASSLALGEDVNVLGRDEQLATRVDGPGLFAVTHASSSATAVPRSRTSEARTGRFSTAIGSRRRAPAGRRNDPPWPTHQPRLQERPSDPTETEQRRLALKGDREEAAELASVRRGCSRGPTASFERRYHRLPRKGLSMPVAPGSRYGPCEVLSSLGAGGMGEVYKARDTRLDRTVAIKVSKESFAFINEALAVASLNHPHVCTLFDVGPDYLVMEYVEGKPLRGPLAVGDALRLANEIADALAHAHKHGIVHRDLKPSNILVTKSGVKVLDFGSREAPAPGAAGRESADAHRRRGRARHPRAHGPGADRGQAGGRADGRLCVRPGPVRAADGPSRLRGHERRGRDGSRPGARSGADLVFLKRSRRMRSTRSS